MKISARGINLIKRFEGRFLKAYYCPAGVLTIGYGHTNLSGVKPKVVPGMTISAADADRILVDTLAAVYEPAVRRNVKREINQHQYDALVSFVYNVGEGNFRKSSVLRAINSGNFNAVPSHLMKWTKGGGRVLKGLVNRRQAEGALWNTPVAGSAPAPAPKPDPKEEVDIPPVENEPMPQEVSEEKESDVSAIWRQVSAGLAAVSAYVFDLKFLVLIGAGIAVYAIWAQSGKPEFWKPSYWKQNASS